MPMVTGLKTYAVGAAALLVFGLAAYWLWQAPDPGFYANALSAAHADRTVMIGITDYAIRGGKVFEGDTEVTDSRRLSILALGYAAAAAERSPQMALPGTDPAALEVEINGLERQQQEQADELRIPSNIHYARTALYPIDFLRALAVAERERQAFVASGSDADLATYLSAVDNAIAAQRRDTAAFAEAYAFLGLKDARLPSPGGTMTSTLVEAALKTAQADAGSSAARAQARRDCFAGSARSCDAADVALPLPPIVADTHDDAAQQLAGKVLSMYTQASATGLGQGYEVALASSTCVASAQGPYFFETLSPARAAQYPLPPAIYLGDFFFSTSTGPTHQLSRGSVTAPVTVINPTIFYHCQDAGLDISRLQTVAGIYRFAQKHPDIATTTRAVLLASSVAHEDDAVAYLRDALANLLQYTGDEQRSLLALALAYRDGSARLDLFANEVWSLNRVNLALRKMGYPFDDSISFLIGTHSGFASLLQLYNPSVVPQTPPLYDRSPGALTAFLATTLRYSQTAPVYRSGIIEYLRQFRSFEHRTGL